MNYGRLPQLFVDHSTRKLKLMQQVLEICLQSVDERALSQRGGPGQNSIANLILHLCGNVRQWIGSAIGGLPDVRDRRAEFEEIEAPSKEEIQNLLRSTLDGALKLISELDGERLEKTVQTQDGPLSVLEVVYQVVGHFQQHTGQIIFAVKLATGRDLELYRTRPR